MPNPLARRECVPCRGGTPPLTSDERQSLLAELGGGWEVQDGHHLYKLYTFEDFQQALDFTNRV